jgi:hypothetical protein
MNYNCNIEQYPNLASSKDLFHTVKICHYQGQLKCNDEEQHGLLIQNQYDVDPLSEPSFSSTQLHLMSEADVGDLARDE